MAHPFASESEAAKQKSYVTYTLPIQNLNPPAVTLLEARSLLASTGTTGFRTWEAALFLATYLHSVEGRSLVHRKNVLELGAGAGLLSILCAKLYGACYVLATDGSGEVVADLQTNLSLNKLDDSQRINATTFLWGHTLVGGVLDIGQETRNYDIILGADVVSRKSRSIQSSVLLYLRTPAVKLSSSFG